MDDTPRDTVSPSRWHGESARALTRTGGTVTPELSPPEHDPAADVHLWDSWLLRNRYGEVVTVDGWQLLFALTTPAELLPGKRHDSAEIRYFYSGDGRDWELGGRVFEGGALGQRQWAGSTVYDGDDIYLFYTAAGDGDAAELTYSQRIAAARGGGITVSPTGVGIDGPWTHEIILEPDGQYYETEKQARGMIYTFRDPWLFEDPATGETHLLFEANSPVPEGSDRCNGDAHRQEFNGSVGVARSPTDDVLEWELQPPLFEAVCVNQELERPHVVVRNGRYYLFFSSHRHTFAPGFEGFDGLYGFVADSLFGAYEPLNGSGLVLTNPANAPYQSYSWMVHPHREEVLVQSFLNYHDFDGTSLDAVAEMPESEQRRRFGGTLGATIRLCLEGETTRVCGVLDPWHIPRADEELPPWEASWPPEDLQLDPDRSRRDTYVGGRRPGYRSGSY